MNEEKEKSITLLWNSAYETPETAEVLTRVMRLGLESDSSHYFCDLRLDLDLQRNDLRLDLDLQGNDLLPTQVKSYSSDPGTS